MNFTENYSDLVKYANILINKYHKQNISADELVADTYIILSTSNPNFTIDEFKAQLKKCINITSDEIIIDFSTDNLATDVSINNRLYIDNSYDKQCKKCKEVKNVSEFRVESRKAKKIVTSKCKDCYNKYMSEYLNRSEDIKNKHNVRMDKYAKTLKGKIKCQRYYNNNKEHIIIYNQLLRIEKGEISSSL